MAILPKSLSGLGGTPPFISVEGTPMEYCITLPRFVLDKNPNTDWNFPVFEDEDGNPIPAEFVLEPRFPILRVAAWTVIRTPRFRQYMAKRYFELGLEEKWVPDFLDHTVQYASLNVLRSDDGVIDLEKVIADHLLTGYGKRDSKVERGWWGDFLEYRHAPPKLAAQARLKARYSLLALALQIHDATVQTAKR